jgi:hypothetical protein
MEGLGGDWLGTGNTKNSFLPFEVARPIVQGLGLGSQAEYFAAGRRGLLPPGLPKDPRAAYLLFGWKSWGDWLGSARQSTLEKRQTRRPFPELVAFVRSLGLRSKGDWFRWAKFGGRPDDIPANPADSYKGEGGQSWPHFLGSTNKKAGEIIYRTFPEAREWARSRRLQSQDEWKAFTKSDRLPSDIPANPWHVYRGRGWINISDWLGKGDRHSKNRKWRNFEKARDCVRALGLQNGADWNAFCKSGKLPADIPAMPGRVYRNSGWLSIGDWLGTNTVAAAKRKFRSFEEAREFVRSHHFQMKTEYEAWARSSNRPSDIPALPSRAYAKTGWLGWGDYLGMHNRWSKTSILGRVDGLSQV